jgi:Domain of unknown function (DUF4062)/SIR2-like domain
MESSPIRVFVSSTSEDLKPFRMVARDAILKVGCIPIMMEDFGAIPDATVLACHKKLSDCQVVLLIQAFRRGWVPTLDQGGNGTDSVTALELAYARDLHPPIPILAMLASETWPGNQWERDEAGRHWVEKFRSGLNLPAEFFDHEDPSGVEDRRLPGFRAKVLSVLQAHRERLLKQMTVRQGGGLDFFDSARDALVKGRAIPFIGTGIYGDGPLSIPALTAALLRDTDPEPVCCLATVSEYRERFLGDRSCFLEEFGELITAQAVQTQLPNTLEMLLKVKPPALLVAATYDQMLEKQLRAAGRKFAVVTHILRSFNCENDGKIVVFRDGTEPVISLADKVELGSDEMVIYRPLGSPLLHEALSPDLAIDTVVITETDHLTFLGRLENQHTKFPTAFSHPFQTRPLVFLGYGLNVWHYRLVMQVFQVVGVGTKHGPIIAVREPASAMEDLAWKRLNVDLVHGAPNDFAERVIRSLPNV